MTRTITKVVMAAAAVLLTLLPLVACNRQPNPVYSISIEKVKVEPPGPPSTGPLPGVPLTQEPYSTRVQQVFQPGDRMFVFIFTNPRLTKSVTFSKYTFFNRQNKVETSLPPNGSFGPFDPSTGFSVAQENPWTVPAQPGQYELRVYVEARIVGSARFDVVVQ
jgi:hypothetical protein